MRHYLIPAFLGLLLLAGCDDDGRDPPPDDLQEKQAMLNEVWRHHGRAEVIQAELALRVEPKGEDAINFQIRVWSPADNRIRIRCSKLGFAFLEGVIEPNNDFRCVLVRSNEYLEGNLENVRITTTNADGEVVEQRSIPFFNNIHLLVSELKDGPLPAIAPTEVNGNVVMMDQPDGDDRARIVIDQNTKEIDSKEIINGAGDIALSIRYGRYGEFDGLQRPEIVQLTPPNDGGDYRMKLMSLDVVPSISEETMPLDIPEDVIPIDVETFVERLGEREEDGE